MSAHPGVSLTRWLVLLVVGALVPLLLLGGVTLYRLSSDAQGASDRGQIDTARALALAIDGEVRSWKAALLALAESKSIRPDRLAEFYEEARRVAEQHDGWVVLTVASGDQLVNTLLPYGAPLYRTSSPETIDAIFREGKPIVSDVFYGKNARRFLVALAVPVVRDGKVVHCLTLNFSPDRLTRLLQRQRLPASWVAAIIDRQAHVAARSLRIEERIGKPVVEWLAAAIRGAESGLATGPLIDGRQGRVAFQRLQEVPWTVTMAVPVAELSTAAQVTGFVLAGMLLTCLAVAAVAVVGRRVSRPVSRLAQASERMLHGDAVDLGPPSDIREVRELQETLGAATTAIRDYYQERERAAVAEERAKVAAASAAALRASEGRLQLFIENAPAAIAMFDRDLRYLAVSRRWRADYGLGDADLLGQSHYAIFPEIPETWKSVHRRALAGEVVRAEEDRFGRLDGTVQWLRWEVRPWHAADGAVGGIVIFTEDIGHLKQAKDELEQRVTERTAELSNALLTLSIQSDQLKSLASELTLAEQRERSHLAELIHDGLQQLLVAVKLRVAMMGRAHDAAIRQECEDIGGLLDEAVADARSLTSELSPPILRAGGFLAGLDWLARWGQEKYHLTVCVQAPAAPLPPLPEDLTVLLFQSVRELLFNAAKYARVSRVEVTCAWQDDAFTLTVVDAGAGFEPRILRGEGGVAGGFGLARIRHRLELLGGCMEIASAPGRGSRITLALPLRFVRQPVAPPPPSPSPSAPPAGVPSVGGLKKIRVLVVDDHQVVRQALAQMLGGEADIEVIGEAGTGRAAVTLARQLVPDVVLMDINMPEMNGIEATRIIHAACPAMRVIGLSMFDRGDQEAALKDAGAVAYLSKNGPAAALLAAIRDTPCGNSGTIARGVSS